jgi:hypothetical protein
VLTSKSGVALSNIAQDRRKTYGDHFSWRMAKVQIVESAIDEDVAQHQTMRSDTRNRTVDMLRRVLEGLHRKRGNEITRSTLFNISAINEARTIQNW